MKINELLESIGPEQKKVGQAGPDFKPKTQRILGKPIRPNPLAGKLVGSMEESAISNQREEEPWGLTGKNSNVEYQGVQVKMLPHTFLKLAAPDYEHRSKEDIKKHIQSGGKIASPFLDVEIRNEGKEVPIYRVIGHEGRNRMAALNEINPDEPVEVHLFFYWGDMKRRHITKQMVAKANTMLKAEHSNAILRGPFFKLMHDLSDEPAKFESLKLKTDLNAETPAKKFLDKLYASYPKNILNNNEVILHHTEDSLVSFELRTSFRGPNWVHLSFMRAYPMRKGLGTLGMRKLQALAAKAGISLEGAIWNRGPVKPKHLADFYRKTGFNVSGTGITWSPSKEKGI